MLHIHLFGHLRLFLDGRPQKFSALPKTIPLLAYLILHRQAHVPRDTLAYTLWPDVPETEARANLRRHLHELRRNLPPAPEETPWIVAETQQVQWNAAAPGGVDVIEFQQLAQRPDKLAEAAALYTGDLLQNIYEEWLEPERERLRAQYLQTLEQLITRSRQQGDLSQAMNYGQQVLHYDPWRENIIREMMQLRLESGDRAGALQEYQRFRQTLETELGVAPMAETRALYQQMLDNRIKSPERPQPNPVTTTTQTSSPRHNLPAPLMSCIGREEAIRELTRLLTGPDAIRLVTLTGPGGIGKTRLALELALQLWQNHIAQFPDGIYFVPLANVQDPRLIAPAIAEVTGLKMTGTQPTWEQVKNHLQNKKMLLWLDNFEQLVAAAPQLTDLLHAAASLHLLITSQAVLRVYGEHEFAVPPLAMPTGDLSDTAIARAPAVTWFAAVARTTNPAFTITPENAATIAQICTRLDGLPLAIELAAARSKLFSPAVILEQLSKPLEFLAGRARDLPARQRTLREAIGWSYSLLTPSEKQLFLALAVFAGNFTLEAAVAVAAQPGGEAQVYNDLESLVDKNILRLLTPADDQEARFRMLLVIREFARDQLAPPAAATYRRRHLLYFQQLCHLASEGLHGHDQLLWSKRLTENDDNIRAALNWAFSDATDREQIEAGYVIVFNLVARFWQMKGRISEALDWVHLALLHRDQVSPQHLLRLLNHGGWMLQLQDDYAQAIPMHEEALTLARQLNDQTRIINSLHHLGAAAGRTGDYARSEAVLSECLTLMRQDPATTETALSTLLNNLGIVQRRLKKYPEAIATLTECLITKQRRGDKAGMASALSNLGMTYTNLGDYATASQHLNQSLLLRREVDDRMGVIFTLNNLSHLAADQDQWPRAISLLAFTEKLREQIHLPVRQETAHELQDLVAQAKAKLGEIQFAAAWQQGFVMPFDEVFAYALNPDAAATQNTVIFASDPGRLITPSPGSLMATPAPLTDRHLLQQELLAVGGMGEVYKAVWGETGQAVIVKRLKPDLLASDPSLLARFNREAELLRQLNHPNIVKILATITDPQDPRLILEYVAGGTLRDLLDRQGKLSLDLILSIGLELADALTRAHHLGIVHRDLKPANILLTEEGSVRLGDFGVAYLTGQGQRLTQAGAVMGTAAYLSPEACLGEELDARSDIWSFGVILVEMVTGKNPFAGSSFTATVSSVIHKPLPDLRPHRPDAPEQLFDLIEQMLTREREKRTLSSRRVAAALEQIQKGV